MVPARFDVTFRDTSGSGSTWSAPNWGFRKTHQTQPNCQFQQFSPVNPIFFHGKKSKKTTQQDPGNMSKKNLMFCWFLNFVDSIRCFGFCWYLYVGYGPFPVAVTTRIITFLEWNPNLNLYLTLLLGGGHTQSIWYLWLFQPCKKNSQAAFEAQELPGELETRQVGGIWAPEKKNKTRKTTIYGIDFLDRK